MADALLLQRLTDASVEVLSVEWLVETWWPGDRLLARIEDGAVTLADALGSPLTHPEVEVAVRAGCLAGSAALDGTWTSMRLVVDGGEAAPVGGAYVAVDLLELDGASLLDVPFAERRRLLESVVRPGPALAVPPAVRVPLDGWLAAWRQNGFTHYVARHQNARYHPGQRADDALRVALGPANAAPPAKWRLTGWRDRIHRIRD